MNLSKDIKIYKEFKGANILKGKYVYEFSEELFNFLEYIIKNDLNSKDIPNSIINILEYLTNIGVIERGNNIG